MRNGYTYKEKYIHKRLDKGWLDDSRENMMKVHMMGLTGGLLPCVVRSLIILGDHIASHIDKQPHRE